MNSGSDFVEDVVLSKYRPKKKSGPPKKDKRDANSEPLVVLDASQYASIVTCYSTPETGLSFHEFPCGKNKFQSGEKLHEEAIAKRFGCSLFLI